MSRMRIPTASWRSPYGKSFRFDAIQTAMQMGMDMKENEVEMDVLTIKLPQEESLTQPITSLKRDDSFAVWLS